MSQIKREIGERSGFLEIKAFKTERIKFRRPRTEAICICHKCGRQDYHVLPYNFTKQKSCGCDRIWNAPPSGEKSKLFKGYKEMSSVFFSKAKARATKKKIPFDLDKRFLWEMYEKQERKCALSGLPIDFGKGSRGRTATASIDRIDSQLGYTQDNVQWLHRDVNLMKMFLEQSYFLTMCQKIVEVIKAQPT